MNGCLCSIRHVGQSGYAEVERVVVALQEEFAGWGERDLGIGDAEMRGWMLRSTRHVLYAHDCMYR
jgi:hypothetical protein